MENGVTEYSVVIVTEYSVTPIQSPYYLLYQIDSFNKSKLDCTVHVQKTI